MKKQLPIWLKLLYGSGDWGIASIGWLRGLFYAIYLTDVVGLDPRLASFGALAGLVWDAVNDPIIGILSDRMRSKLGRRRPFLLWFAIPFGFSFVMLWSAPHLGNDYLLLAYVTFAFMISDTLTTLVAVPYYSLTPDLTHDYDERTELSSYRTVFQLIGALVVVIAAPMIVDAVLENGGTQQQGFMLTGAIFGGIGALPLLLLGMIVREKHIPTEEEAAVPFMDTLKISWRNIPFRYAAGIYMCNWSAVDMVIVTFPFFLLYWISSGNPLQKAGLLGFDIAIESAFFGTSMIVCILVAPFWMWFSKKFNKQAAYILGMSSWVVVQLMIFTIQPGQTEYLIWIAALAGIGVSAAYIIPDSMLPDVIEWDELFTGKRQEGVYYGIRTLIRKLTGAVVSFMTFQVLGWSGYQQPLADGVPLLQADFTLTMIRLMSSIFGGVLLLGTIILAWYYPLTRERYARVEELLKRRREIRARIKKAEEPV